MSRKLIIKHEVQSELSDVCVMEETLTDGSKVYNVEAHTRGGGSYLTLAYASGFSAAMRCAQQIAQACDDAAL